MTSPATYRSYKNLPPLAGLATFEEATKPGLGIEACVTRLKRFHYCFKRLHEILTARITSEPIYELKTAFAHHAYLCAEHADALRTRVGEMREPPLGLEDVPHPALEVFFDEILAAPTTVELLGGLYQQAILLLELEIDAYRSETNTLIDAPSMRILRFALLELKDMHRFGSKCVANLVDDEILGSDRARINYLNCLWLGIDQPRMYSAKPFDYDPVPRRDERWQDPWNQGVNPEAFLYDPGMPSKPKALMMLFKRIREIDVPEMMAGILTEMKGKPWRFYRDMSRQLWDEARHAMMGEVGFVALGIDWTKARITHNWSYRLNTECTPTERHAVLFFLEQGLMNKTGSATSGRSAGLGHPNHGHHQDFDWADEVLHAAIGRQWHVPNFENLTKALAYGDELEPHPEQLAGGEGEGAHGTRELVAGRVP